MEESRRPPNEHEKLAGYYLLNLRHNYELLAKVLGYRAVKYVEMSKEIQVLDEARGFGMEWGRGQRILNESLNAGHLVGEAHDQFREILKKRGVKGIKNADFDVIESEYDFSQLEEEGVEIGSDAKGYYIKCRIGGGCR